MRPPWWVVAFLGCGGPSTPPRATVPDGSDPPVAFADEDRHVPAYAKSELSRALQKERGLEAAQDRQLAEIEAKDHEHWLVARADLAVRRRFIQALEACERSGRWCPPRLDDPPWPADAEGTKIPVTAALRFDLASWRALADELHGRACACRTLHCVDTVGMAIDQLEARPMPEVQGDEVASLAITRARQCLFRLRGRSGRAPRVELPASDR